MDRGGALGCRPRLHAAPLVQSARGHPAGPERVERLGGSSSPRASPKHGSVVIGPTDRGKAMADGVLSAALAAGLAVCVLAAPAGAADDGEPTLLGRGILASDAYQPGPPSGAFIAPDNGVTPPFPGQPIPASRPSSMPGTANSGRCPITATGRRPSPATSCSACIGSGRTSRRPRGQRSFAGVPASTSTCRSSQRPGAGDERDGAPRIEGDLDAASAGANEDAALRHRVHPPVDIRRAQVGAIATNLAGPPERRRLTVTGRHALRRAATARGDDGRARHTR
jgi:hypothetical protein